MTEILLGKTNHLRIVKQVDFGYYLEGTIRGNRTEVLLPAGEVDAERFPAGFGTDENAEHWLDVFIYLDQEERAVATMRKPLAEVGDFAFLEVAWVNNFGAFMHWGLQKDLFVPFREQKMKMQKGRSYIVHLHIDPTTYRIVASAKIERYLSQETPPYHAGDEVDILVWQKTDLGLKVIVDNRFGGLLYDDQIFRQVRTGDRLKAYVSQVRPDGKLDLSLQAKGQKAVTDFSATLLAHIRANGGRSELSDKSPAEEIYALFGVSKKVFKKAVGDLYRRRLITITDEALELADAKQDNS